jgi:large subunit ribosomal protein L21e
MVKRKSVRTRGKISLKRYFQEFENEEKVAVVEERAIQSSFPKRLQGRTGKIEGKRGRAYVVKIKDQNMDKLHLINPIHLKKIKG